MISEWAKSWAGFAMWQRFQSGRGDGRRMGQSYKSQLLYIRLETQRRAAEHD